MKQNKTKINLSSAFNFHFTARPAASVFTVSWHDEVLVISLFSLSLPKNSLPPGTIRPWPMHTTCMHTTINSGWGRSTLDLRSMLSYLLCSLAKQHRKQHSEGANWWDSVCCLREFKQWWWFCHGLLTQAILQVRKSAQRLQVCVLAYVNWISSMCCARDRLTAVKLCCKLDIKRRRKEEATDDRVLRPCAMWQKLKTQQQHQRKLTSPTIQRR